MAQKLWDRAVTLPRTIEHSFSPALSVIEHKFTVWQDLKAAWSTDTHSKWMRRLLTQYANNLSSTAGVQVKRRMKNVSAGSGYFKTLKDPIFSKEIKNEMGKVWVLKWGVIRCCSLQKSNLLYLLRSAARLDYAAFSSWAWPHFAFYHAVIKCLPAWAIISNKWPGTSTEAEHLHHTERVKKRRLWNRDQKQHSLLHAFFLLKTSVSAVECRFSSSIISANPRHVGWMSVIYLKEKKRTSEEK